MSENTEGPINNGQLAQSNLENVLTDILSDKGNTI
jgi:hypothetical protein